MVSRKQDRLDSHYFKTTSPQGDGNNPTPPSEVVPYISKPHPRKGTETNLNHAVTTVHFAFQNHIPARGRKHPKSTAIRLAITRHFKTTSPQGDGNFPCKPFLPRMPDRYFKTTSPQGDGNCAVLGECREECTDFKTTSPQGDGNSDSTMKISVSSIISKPHPRKGTETMIQ